MMNRPGADRLVIPTADVASLRVRLSRDEPDSESGGATGPATPTRTRSRATAGGGSAHRDSVPTDRHGVGWPPASQVIFKLSPSMLTDGLGHGPGRGRRRWHSGPGRPELE